LHATSYASHAPTDFEGARTALSTRFDGLQTEPAVA
jgi:hypothetical protein